MFLKKIITTLFLFLFVLSFSQCKPVQKNDVAAVKQKHLIPMSKVRTDTIRNKDHSMELVLESTHKISDPATRFKYVVYQSKTKKIIKEGTFRGMGVEWNDNTSLKLIPYVGMIEAPDSKKLKDDSSFKTQSRIIIVKLNIL